jgi:hypothetical protein
VSDSDEPQKLTVDLASLALPPRIAIDFLGEVQVDILSADFEVWVDAWIGAPSGDAQEFVRQLLAAHATKGDPPVGLDASQIGVGTDIQLDQAADALLEAAAWRFRPKYISSGSGTARKVRKRTDAEAYDLSQRGDETSADRLLRVLTDWRQDRRNFKWLTEASARRAATEMLRAYRDATGVQRLIDQRKAIPLALPSAFERSLLDSPAYRIAEITRRQQEQFRSLGLAPDVFHGYRRQTQSLLAAIRSAPTIATLTQYPQIGSALTALKLGSELAAAMRTNPLHTALSGLKPYDLSQLQLGWIHTANRRFDLRLPGATLAAIAAIHQPLVGTDGLRMTPFPPGFQLVAGLGLSGSAPAGAVADLLNFYDAEPPGDTPAFDATRGVALLIDESPANAIRMIDHLEGFLEWLATAARKEVDIVRRQGYIALFFMACTLFSTWNDVTDESASKADVAGVAAQTTMLNRKIEGLEQQLKAQRLERADDRRFLRYVRSRAPLRLEPHGGAILVRYIYPDQELRLLDERGAWVLVEAYDYHGEQLVRGWMARSRLRMTPQG